jgi:hypothetical protein
LEGAEPGEPDRKWEDRLSTSSQRQREEGSCNHCDDEHKRLDKPGGSEVKQVRGFDDRGVKGGTGRCPEDDRLVVVRRKSRAPSEGGGSGEKHHKAETKQSASDERRAGPDGTERCEVEEIAILDELVGSEAKVE